MNRDEPQDPRVDLLKLGGPMLQAMRRCLEDPICLKWFDTNGFDHSARCQLVLALCKLGLAYAEYGKFLEDVIIKGQNKNERKTNLNVPSD